ncbi:hypothetical protein N9937_00670 [bacterium]|nr:hypothetical protein [bacterium]
MKNETNKMTEADARAEYCCICPAYVKAVVVDSDCLTMLNLEQFTASDGSVWLVVYDTSIDEYQMTPWDAEADEWVANADKNNADIIECAEWAAWDRN